MSAKRLTPKQEAFAVAYIELGNAAEAYRRVYRTSGRPEIVYVAASRLLDNAKVALRVAELKERAASVAVATREDVLRFWTMVLRTDIREVRKAPEEWTPEAALTVLSVEEDRISSDADSDAVLRRKVRQYDKLRASELLAKFFDMFPKESVSVEAKFDIASLVQLARQSEGQANQE